MELEAARQAALELQLQEERKQRKEMEAARQADLNTCTRLMQETELNMRSSPLPATLGLSAHRALTLSHCWKQAEGNGPPVLGDADLLEYPDSFESESALINWFTPRLQVLVQEASKRIGAPLVLVNTEQHAYLRDPHGGAPSKPDMLVTHPAFYKWNEGQIDAQLDGQGFIFGEGGGWVLRDSWEVLWKWKKNIGPNDFSALGEGIEYARRKSSEYSEIGVPEDEESRLVTRLIVSDANTFYLVWCYGADPKTCVWGRWKDAGSRDAVIQFLVGDTLNRKWVNAIELLCKQFAVEIVIPSKYTPSCFLGSGISGRVFLVEKDSIQYALKIGLGDQNCTQIVDERWKFKEFLDRQLDIPIVTLEDSYVCPNRGFAGLLISPVGRPLQCISEVLSAVQGLKALALAGFCHGDARVPNVVWCSDSSPEMCKWLDFRTAYRVADEDRFGAFFRDVTTFFHSFKPDEETEAGDKFEAAALKFFERDEENVDELISSGFH